MNSFIRSPKDFCAALIYLTIGLGGRFFLPYQLHYSPEQLQQAYPQIGTFFEAKRRIAFRISLAAGFA